MKANIHPKLHNVLYHDLQTGVEFPSLSTQTSQIKKTVDGVEYYVIQVEISAASHPFFTGEQRFVDRASRIQSFEKKKEIAKQFKSRVTKKQEERKQKQDGPKSLRDMLMGAK